MLASALPRPTVAGTKPTHVISTPLILLGFISRIRVNFLIYYTLCLAPPPSSLSCCAWKRPPPTKNQPPRGQDQARHSLGFLFASKRKFTEKKIPCLYKEDRTQWGNGDLLSIKAASEAESSKALGVSCCLIYINGRIKFFQGVETGRGVCFLLLEIYEVPRAELEKGGEFDGFPIDEQKLSLFFFNSYAFRKLLKNSK